ncbi:MAG: TetR/AcrR family transcriptional regulator [Spirochaetes bacterium]|nr:MAG: TetR/AcrR family transcriptional regulator [Spirochaetota bacterium]
MDEKLNSVNLGVPTQIKNQGLIERRRRQIIEAAVELFVDRGFHKTTTRQIAARAGLASGSMYEYVASKEDILYLVCNAIHEEMERSIGEVMVRAGQDRQVLEDIIREYFMVCHRMRDHILLIYQEAKSLPAQWRERVLQNDIRIAGIFADYIRGLMESGALQKRDEAVIEMIAHNVTVLGHMWTFRRWFFGKRFSIEEYTSVQTEFITGILRK